MPTEALSTVRMRYVSLLCVLSFIAVSDADLILKTDPTTLGSNRNEKLTICCVITNNSVQQLTNLSFLNLTRLSKSHNSVYDTLVYWYINESSRAEPAPLFDKQRGLITSGENRVCLTIKNATSDDATSYKCEVYGLDAERNALRKINTKGFVKYVNTSKEIRQNETITERSVQPSENTSCSFNRSLSESDADFYKNQSKKFEILSVFIAGPKQQSNVLQDTRRISVSSRRENKTTEQVTSQLLSVTLNEPERSYLECLTAERRCEDQIMYILGPLNQSIFEQNINLSLFVNTPTATKPDVHTCTSNESQHSFFGIIGSELDMRLVCAFNLNKIYVFFSALLSPQEMDIFTYMDKNSIEIILKDLFVCINQLKATSSEPNPQVKIITVLDTIESLLTQISSEILSGPDNRTAEANNGNREDSISMNNTRIFKNGTLIENLRWIIELFKSLKSENQNGNLIKEKELLTAILQFKDDYVLTKQAFNEFLSSLKNTLDQFKGQILKADNLLLSEMQLQLHRNYSVINRSIQKLNNSFQDILEQHFTRISTTDNFTQQFKQDMEIFDTISKNQNQTMKHDELQKDIFLKIQYLVAAIEKVKSLHQNDHLKLSKSLQISKNDLQDYMESSSAEISEIKDRTDNQEKLLEELNSDSQNLARDIKSINVTLRGDFTKLFVISQDLKDYFIKFFKDDHRNRSSVDILKIKDDQERNLTMLYSGVKRVEDDIQIMNSTINTYFANISSQFQAIKDDLINCLKTSDIDDLKNLNIHIQKDVLFTNHTLKNTTYSLNKTHQKDFNNPNILFQTANKEIKTIKSDFSTLKSEMDKLSRKNKELTNENINLRQLYSQMNNEIKTLQQNFMTNSKAAANCTFHVSNSYKGRRYYLTKEKLFYCIRAAQFVCSGYGGYLAEVNDLSELNFIKSFLKSKDPCTWDSVIYIGGTDEAVEGRWVHISKGTPVVSGFWESGQPGGGRTENCQAFERCSLLHDYSCLISTPSRKFLCEIPE